MKADEDDAAELMVAETSAMRWWNGQHLGERHAT